MRPPTRLRAAPLVDAACIVAFVVLGRDRHGIHQGVGWFATVLWPLFLGWFSVALLTRVYTRRAEVWNALTLTLFGGIAVAAVLRGTFTDRPYASVFTIIALAFLGLTTFGWRAVVGAVRARRSKVDREVAR
jgi:hypothetical protein